MILQFIYEYDLDISVYLDVYNSYVTMSRERFRTKKHYEYIDTMGIVKS